MTVTVTVTVTVNVPDTKVSQSVSRKSVSQSQSIRQSEIVRWFLVKLQCPHNPAYASEMTSDSVRVPVHCFQSRDQKREGNSQSENLDRRNYWTKGFTTLNMKKKNFSKFEFQLSGFQCYHNLFMSTSVRKNATTAKKKKKFTSFNFD